MQVPNETFKAASHLVVTGRKRKYTDVKIILAHLGGSTPFLAPRVAVLSPHMGCTLSPEEIIEDFKSFYYETALSTSSINLTAMDAFVSPDRVLFGTDFPGQCAISFLRGAFHPFGSSAVSTEMADWYTQQIEEHYADNKEKLEGVLGGNALKLFPRFWS